ncbi:YdcF family protein [uncultured Acinetobacter sp.]|uniref:YdcF family protein n=1 Tax=uncultured Acinetobacter sp. TaxID=165433 RepID=UPI002583D0D0|nr:YdcF family protein [uncultured Acinetobacter sp.]
MTQIHWMIRLVRAVAILFVLAACLMVFIYTPFYSKMIVKGLNYFVPVEVNQVAAKSQQNASLSEHENLEPGSNLWIARQAYLRLVEEAMSQQKFEELGLLQARYRALQQRIEDEQLKEQQEDEKNATSVPLLAKKDEATHVKDAAKHEKENPENPASASSVIVSQLFDLNHSENKALRDKYIVFLKTHPVTTPEDEASKNEITEDIEFIRQNQSDLRASSYHAKPYAIVVLGGGLTLADNRKDIVVNAYTKLRLEKTLEIEKKYKLPIVLSGVEAPYMQAWLKERGVEAKLLENRSMNTCENSRFSSLLLQKKGGAPTVMLVTDVYHMPRTRRLFALNGIETIPVEAPMPTQLSAWQPSQQNYDHSRRANYELLATVRDMLFGSSGCREVP